MEQYYYYHWYPLSVKALTLCPSPEEHTWPGFNSSGLSDRFINQNYWIYNKPAQTIYTPINEVSNPSSFEPNRWRDRALWNETFYKWDTEKWKDKCWLNSKRKKKGAVTVPTTVPRESIRCLKYLQTLSCKRKATVLRHVGNTWWTEQSLVLLLLVCEEVNHSRDENDHNLRHDDEFDKEEAVEDALWSDWEWQPVHVVQSHGWNGQW